MHKDFTRKAPTWCYCTQAIHRKMKRKKKINHGRERNKEVFVQQQDPKSYVFLWNGPTIYIKLTSMRFAFNHFEKCMDFTK